MKYCVFFSLLIIGTALHGQDYHPQLKTDHLAIVVDDLEESVRFYGQVLGLQEIVNQTKKPNIRWFSFADGVELHLIKTSKEGISTTKNLHMALAVEELASFLKMLDKKGIAYESWQGENQASNTRPDGVNQVYIQDPNGYWIEINDARRFEY